MWVMFLFGALVSATSVLLICKAGHKLYMSMLKDERNFKRENDEYEKNRR